MAKMNYVKKWLCRRNLELIGHVNEVISLYGPHENKPAVIEIFRFLVSQGILENTQAAHIRLNSVIRNGRALGLIDKNALQRRQRRGKGVEL